jgi:hypothetical protein
MMGCATNTASGTRCKVQTPKQPVSAPPDLFDKVAQARTVGRWLYEVDQAADAGMKVFVENVPEARRRELLGSVTVVDTIEDKPSATSFMSTFLTREIPARVAYRVRTVPGKDPIFETVSPSTLADDGIVAQLRARETALAGIQLPAHPLKAVVLPGRLFSRPTSLVVYLLRPERSRKELALGMHYRAVVSSDGRTLEAIEPLSDIPAVYDLRMIYPNEGCTSEGNLRFDYPNETYVYMSLKHDGLPLLIMTRRSMWMVAGDTINGGEAPLDPTIVRMLETRRDAMARRPETPATAEPPSGPAP